jgi:hypothetical protein
MTAENKELYQNRTRNVVASINRGFNALAPGDHFVVTVLNSDLELENGFEIEGVDCSPKVKWTKNGYPFELHKGKYEYFGAKCHAGLQWNHTVSINKDKIDQAKLFDILVDEFKFFIDSKFFAPGLVKKNGKVMDKVLKRPNYCITFAFDQNLVNIQDFVTHVQQKNYSYSFFRVEVFKNTVSFYTLEKHKNIAWRYIQDIATHLNKRKTMCHLVFTVLESHKELENGYMWDKEDHSFRWLYWDKTLGTPVTLNEYDFSYVEVRRGGWENRNHMFINKNKIDQTKLIQICVAQMADFFSCCVNVPEDFCITFAFEPGIVDIDSFVKQLQETYPNYARLAVDKQKNAVSFCTQIIWQGD